MGGTHSEQALYSQGPQALREKRLEPCVREPCRFWSPVAIVSELSRPEGRDHPVPRHPLTRSGGVVRPGEVGRDTVSNNAPPPPEEEPSTAVNHHLCHVVQRCP